MPGFRYLLHPVHGSFETGLKPLRVAELEGLDDFGDRLVALTSAARASAQELGRSTAGLIEVFRNDIGLYVLNNVAERLLWLPLPLCQLVGSSEVHASASEDLVGVLAYGYPLDDARKSWGPSLTAVGAAGTFGMGDVWLIVVSFDGRRGDQVRAIVEESAEELGGHLAIRSSLLGLQSPVKALGKGAFATVRLLRRAGRASLRAAVDVEDASENDGVGMYALKTVSSTAAAEIFAEASYLSAVQGHANVCRYDGLVFDLLSAGDKPWNFVMEAHVRGSVRSVVHERGRGLEATEALEVTEGLLKALIHVHARGIIHRDVKPDNLLIAADGRAVLVDFGIATHVSEVERMVSRRGTAGCVAPEILRKDHFGPKADVFSSGVVLYYTLGGIMPFLDNDIEKTWRLNFLAKVRFPDPFFENTGKCLRKVVKTLLRANAYHRPCSTVARALVGAAILEIQDNLPLPGSNVDGQAEDEDAEEEVAAARSRSKGSNQSNPSSWMSMRSRSFESTMDETNVSSSFTDMLSASTACSSLKGKTTSVLARLRRLAGKKSAPVETFSAGEAAASGRGQKRSGVLSLIVPRAA